MDERRRRFTELVLPHLDAAANLARWLTRSEAEADDVVQDAMLRAFRAFDGFRGASAKPWLLAIVRNCSVNAMAQKKRYTALPEDHVEADLAPGPEDLVLRGEETRDLAVALAALPPDFREALVLREMEEMSYRDIAAATGVPIGTVMSRLARGRALLRQAWLGQENRP
jgi:RNA polymerase sigma-70 factor (ECF subfamily)